MQVKVTAFCKECSQQVSETIFPDEDVQTLVCPGCKVLLTTIVRTKPPSWSDLMDGIEGHMEKDFSGTFIGLINKLMEYELGYSIKNRLTWALNDLAKGE